MTKEDDKDIAKLQLQLQIAEAKNRGEAMKEMDAGQKLELAKTDLERERLRGMDGNQKLKYKAVDSIDKALGKALGTFDHIVRDDEEEENSNSKSGNDNDKDNTVDSNSDISVIASSTKSDKTPTVITATSSSSNHGIQESSDEEFFSPKSHESKSTGGEESPSINTSTVNASTVNTSMVTGNVSTTPLLSWLSRVLSWLFGGKNSSSHESDGEYVSPSAVTDALAPTHTIEGLNFVPSATSSTSSLLPSSHESDGGYVPPSAVADASTGTNTTEGLNLNEMMAALLSSSHQSNGEDVPPSVVADASTPIRLNELAVPTNVRLNVNELIVPTSAVTDASTQIRLNQPIVPPIAVAVADASTPMYTTEGLSGLFVPSTTSTNSSISSLLPPSHQSNERNVPPSAIAVADASTRIRLNEPIATPIYTTEGLDLNETIVPPTTSTISTLHPLQIDFLTPQATTEEDGRIGRPMVEEKDKTSLNEHVHIALKSFKICGPRPKGVHNGFVCKWCHIKKFHPKSAQAFSGSSCIESWRKHLESCPHANQETKDELQEAFENKGSKRQGQTDRLKEIFDEKLKNE